jgi:hypothetical protein
MKKEYQTNMESKTLNRRRERSIDFVPRINEYGFPKTPVLPRQVGNSAFQRMLFQQEAGLPGSTGLMRSSASIMRAPGEENDVWNQVREAQQDIGELLDGAIEANDRANLFIENSATGNEFSDQGESNNRNDPNLDRALRNLELARQVTLVLLSNSHLVDLALTLDEEVISGIRSDGGALGPLERSAKAETLRKIYRIVDQRITKAFSDGNIDEIDLPSVDGITWDSNSPLAGNLADISPFGNLDIWATYANTSVEEIKSQKVNPSIIVGTPRPSLHDWLYWRDITERETERMRQEADRHFNEQNGRNTIISAFYRFIADHGYEPSYGDTRIQRGLPYLQRLEGYKETIRSLLMRPEISHNFNNDLTTNVGSGHRNRSLAYFQEGEREALRTWNNMSKEQRRAVRSGNERWDTMDELDRIYQEETRR